MVVVRSFRLGSLRVVTKYRYKVLTGGIAERVRGLAKEPCEAFEIRIIKGVVSKDHVHKLVSSAPTMVPREIMRRLKGRTSSKCLRNFPIYGRGIGDRISRRGVYFCATVEQMTEEMLQQYLEYYFEPRPNNEFRMEWE